MDYYDKYKKYKILYLNLKGKGKEKGDISPDDLNEILDMVAIQGVRIENFVKQRCSSILTKYMIGTDNCEYVLELLNGVLNVFLNTKKVNAINIVQFLHLGVDNIKEMMENENEQTPKIKLLIGITKQFMIQYGFNLLDQPTDKIVNSFLYIIINKKQKGGSYKHHQRGGDMMDWVYEEFKKQLHKTATSLANTLVTDGAGEHFLEKPQPWYCQIVIIYMMIGIFYNFIKVCQYREARGEALTTGDISLAITQFIFSIAKTPAFLKKKAVDLLKYGKDQYYELRPKREQRRVAH